MLLAGKGTSGGAGWAGDPMIEGSGHRGDFKSVLAGNHAWEAALRSSS